MIRQFRPDKRLVARRCCFFFFVMFAMDYSGVLNLEDLSLLWTKVEVGLVWRTLFLGLVLQINCGVDFLALCKVNLSMFPLQCVAPTGYR